MIKIFENFKEYEKSHLHINTYVLHVKLIQILEKKLGQGKRPKKTLFFRFKDDVTISFKIDEIKNQNGNWELGSCYLLVGKVNDNYYLLSNTNTGYINKNTFEMIKHVNTN